MKKTLTPILLVLLFLVSGCGGASESGTPGETETNKPVITVSVLPQQYFVRRIAGDTFRINVMIPPGHSPATYEPSPREMTAVSESILYFRIGHIVFEEAWMDKLTALNRDMKVVDTSAGVSLIKGAPHTHPGDDHDHAEHDHEHGDQKEVSRHEGIDPHIWLSPTAVQIQAKHILDALSTAAPDQKSVFETNYQTFIAEVQALHIEIQTLLRPLKGQQFMVYHPAWSYFAREYGLVQFPIEIEGKQPGAKDMKQVMDTAKAENIRVIFVQRQFDADSARAVAEGIGGTVIALDPLAPDWPANMRKIARTFSAALTTKQ